MSLATAKALLEHALVSPEDEAKAALDLAEATIRREKLDALCRIVEGHVEEVRALEKIRGLAKLQIASGKGNPAAVRLAAVLDQMPKFDPQGGIRGATPVFEFCQKHNTEIQNLLKAI